MLMVKCPYCNSEEGFEELKSWKLKFYDVKMLRCSKCNGIFNLYSGISSKGKRTEFVMKVKSQVKDM